MQFLAIAALLIFCVSAAGQTPEEQDDIVRVEADLTNLVFTVTDNRQRFITTLREEDIRVLEDGVHTPS